MSQNTFDQRNDLVPRLAAADETRAAEHARELLDTELAPEVLATIVGGVTGDDNQIVGDDSSLYWG